MKLQALAAALVIAVLAGSGAAPTAAAEKKYGPGASDTEIKIGNTMPYETVAADQAQRAQPR